MKRLIEHVTVGVALTLILLIVGCAVTRTIEDPPGSGHLKKVAETDPRFTNALNTAKAVGDATAPVNPWYGLVTVLFGAAAGVAEWNRRRKQAQLDAVIAGVEAKGGTEVKTAIQNVAMANGVEAALNKSVQKVTG